MKLERIIARVWPSVCAHVCGYENSLEFIRCRAKTLFYIINCLLSIYCICISEPYREALKRALEPSEISCTEDWYIEPFNKHQSIFGLALSPTLGKLSESVFSTDLSTRYTGVMYLLVR